MTGISSSLLLILSMSCVTHWFIERCSLASGVLILLVMQSLLPQIGGGFSIRIVRFVLLVLCMWHFAQAAFLSEKEPKESWRETLPCNKIFMGGTGSLIVSLFICTVLVLGTWVPDILTQAPIPTHYWLSLYYYSGPASVQMLA